MFTSTPGVKQPSSLTKQALQSILMLNDLPSMISKILKLPYCRKLCEDYFLKEIDSQMQLLATVGEASTVLSSSNHYPIDKLAEAATMEIEKRVPFLYQIICMAGRSATVKEEWYMLTVYATLMHRRNQKLNSFQRLLTASLVRYHAGYEVIKMNLQDLNVWRSDNECVDYSLFQLIPLFKQLHLSVAPTTRYSLLDQAANEVHQSILPYLSESLSCKITVDNIDGRIHTNQVQLYLIVFHKWQGDYTTQSFA